MLKNILLGAAADMLAMVYVTLTLGSGRYEREAWLLGAGAAEVISRVREVQGR